MATKTPIIGKGITIGTAATSAGPFPAIAKIKDVKVPETEVGKAESTTSSDASEQFIPGWEHGGDAEFEVNYNSATTVTLSALIGTTQWFQIMLPDGTSGTTGSTWTFQAFISKYAPGTPLKQVVTEKITLTLNGVPTFAAGT